MKYRVDYLADDPKPLQAGNALVTMDRGVTTLIHADTDEAAHQLALLHVPADMALHSVYRVEVPDYERRELRDKIAKLPEYGFGELHDTIALLLNALDEADSEADTLRARVAELEADRDAWRDRAFEHQGERNLCNKRLAELTERAGGLEGAEAKAYREAAALLRTQTHQASHEMPTSIRFEHLANRYEELAKKADRARAALGEES